MKYVFFFLLLGGYVRAVAQPLHVGDDVPSIKLENIYNYKPGSADLASLKDKLVIIDFWTSHCMACLEKFPQMHGLKKKFGRQLEIFMVNTSDRDSFALVQKLFERLYSTTGNKFTLPYLLQDTMLRQRFPFVSNPHLVWLYKGKVVAITEGEDATAKNIEAMLGGGVKLLLKDDSLRYQKNQLLLVNGVGGAADSFTYRTIVTTYRRELQGAFGVTKDKQGKYTKMYYINFPLWQLFSLAYPDIFNADIKSILNESSVNIYERFCYETVTPPLTYERIQQYFKEDLLRNFRVRPMLDTMEINIYTLERNNKKLSKNSHDTLPISIGQAVAQSFETLQVPVYTGKDINEKELLKMPLQYDRLEPDDWKELLKAKGFLLVPGRRKLPLLVFRDITE